MGTSLYFLDGLIKHHPLEGIILKTLGIMMLPDFKSSCYLHPRAESRLGSWLGHTWGWHGPGTLGTGGMGSCTYDIPKALFITVRDQCGWFTSRRLSDCLPKISPWQCLPSEWSADGGCKHVVPLPSPSVSQSTSPCVPDEVAKPVTQHELLGSVRVYHRSVMGHNAHVCGEQSKSLGFCWICWKTLLSHSFSSCFSFVGNGTLAVPWQKLFFLLSC